MKKLSVAYYRTSSNGNVGKEKDSKKRQQVECMGYAEKNNLNIEKEFYEQGVKGKDLIEDRQVFTEMLIFCEANQINTILFENASRFSRDLITQETGYRVLSSKGYKLISCDSPNAFIEDSPTSKMIRQILGSVSEFEKDNLVSKLKGARMRKREANKAKGILTKDGKGKCEGVKSYDEMNPELIKEARRLRRKNPITKKRMPYRQIAEKLYGMGYSTRNGKTFALNQVVRFCE
ncbi:MAG: recombinase family protein [Bacteroidetes bacterium]|nr:recombinase family protein [Bacteroidota bacterium]